MLHVTLLGIPREQGLIPEAHQLETCLASSGRPAAPRALTGPPSCLRGVRRVSYQKLLLHSRAYYGIVGALAACLASASLRVRGDAGALRDVHCGENLRRRRVDADSLVKVRLGRPAPHRHRKALGHLACVRPAHMQPNDTVRIGRVDEQLYEGAPVATRLDKSPLERLVVLVEYL